MTRFLIALYPRRWRERYGAELQALVDDTGVTPLGAVDLVVGAAREHVRQRPALGRLLLAVFVSLAVELAVARSHLADNILWSPTTVPRALALEALAAAWAPLVVHLARHRRAPDEHSVAPVP